MSTSTLTRCASCGRPLPKLGNGQRYFVLVDGVRWHAACAIARPRIPT